MIGWGPRTRTVAAAAALALALAGQGVALRNETGRPPDAAAITAEPAFRQAAPNVKALAAAPTPGRPAIESASAPLETPAPTGEVSPTPRAVAAVAQPSTTTGTAATGSDHIPRFKDITVLNRAASALLPVGLTFEDCVERPPSHEQWPTPVHLYYEGNGRWLVETHLSEVQVVFDEATEAFTVRKFEPANAGCR